MDGGEKRKKVPRQRGLASRELCQDGDLCPEAQHQWDVGMTKVPSLRGVVWALTGAQRTHIHDVMSKVLLAYYRRCRRTDFSGPGPFTALARFS
ncbi:hypothetical protein ACFYU4_12000 [Streptomyces tendae]|uniref:hypothetical protein n=1 Tax=Streptomyces tendae TaxID=1932 RepID=UPI0036B7304A